MKDWHHGHSARNLLRVVSLALRECATERQRRLPGFVCFSKPTQWMLVTAEVLELRAEDLSPDAYDLVSDTCHALLTAGRNMVGSPLGSMRLDYLLCGIAEQQPNWTEPLKRRPGWLGKEALATH